jgi:hypothetical protein
VKISIEGTELEFATLEAIKLERSETDWVHCRVKEREKRPSINDRRFEGFGGPSNRSEIISIFQKWVEAKP